MDIAKARGVTGAVVPRTKAIAKRTIESRFSMAA
jgi:hypothetical protein